jgi:hypothetical protein
LAQIVPTCEVARFLCLPGSLSRMVTRATTRASTWLAARPTPATRVRRIPLFPSSTSLCWLSSPSRDFKLTQLIHRHQTCSLQILPPGCLSGRPRLSFLTFNRLGRGLCSMQILYKGMGSARNFEPVGSGFPEVLTIFFFRCRATASSAQSVHWRTSSPMAVGSIARLEA